jgi:NhaP-type Na+/H+ or K+/H+ antiporter
MPHNTWFIVIGTLLVGMALAGSVLKRLPLTTAMLYLAVGMALGPALFGMIQLDPLDDSALLERITEVAVIISLFTAGLKLRTGFTDVGWHLPLRLAVVSMILTVGMVTLVSMVVLQLPLGAAVLLGAILAPTDPVLASDVQVEKPGDQDRLRFSLTGEAGLNDGTAFPFVMLGLGLLGLHELGPLGWRWLAMDVVWSVAAGLGVGALLGTLVGYLVVYLRREHKETVGLDDFLALGLIALAYGVALLVHTYGFLAVFAAGLALRHIELRTNREKPVEQVLAMTREGQEEEVATHPEKASAYMAQAVLGFNEKLERIAEVGVVVLLGGMLTTRHLPLEALWFVPLLLLVIRPLSVALGLAGSPSAGTQRLLAAWFGIRGIGSLYYLMYAIQHGLPGELAQQLTGLTLTVVAVSIVVHGISVTPLMSLYDSWTERRAAAAAARRSTFSSGH